MARQQKPRKRDIYGGGSIVKTKGGRFQFWYINPVTGKRAAKVLTREDETGRLVPVRTREEAEESAIAERERLVTLTSIRDTEHAQIAIAKTRKLIAGLTMTPSDIWPKFMDSPTRPQNASNARQTDQKRVIMRLVEWCGQQRPAIQTMNDITPEALAQFLNDRYGKLSGRSYCGAIAILRHVFKHSYKALGLNANPAEDLEGKALKNKSRKEFTEAEARAILNGFETGFYHDAEVVRLTTGGKSERVIRRLEYKPEFPEQFRVLILLMLFTGCRCGDACTMTWSNVDLSANNISFKPHKTAGSSGVVVSLPIHNLLKDGLLEALEWKRDNYILPDVAARYANNNTGIYITVKKIIACATGLEVTAKDGDGRGAAQYGAHSFRHTFVSFCASAGVPLAVVQQIVGHGSPAMTEHYFNASMEAKQKAISTLPLFVATPQEITSRQYVLQFLERCTDAEADELKNAIEAMEARHALPATE